MKYASLGKTSLQVSTLCLGTMTWGQQNTEAEAHQQMDRALEAGINFFDTAEMYPVPGRAETQGRTETYIGTWFANRKNRDKIILATKVVGRAPGMTWIRNGGARLNRKNIEEAVENSLRRLQTDYIDLYQLHWPDRHTNYFGKLGYQHDAQDEFVPLEETLEALQQVIQTGKIRYIGVSNETPWGVMRYLELSKAYNFPRMVSIQNPYSLLNRTFEVGLAEIAMREQIGLLAYSPLGFGRLSGKYIDGLDRPEDRLNQFPVFDRYNNPQALAATQQYVALARKHGLRPAQMALSFVNQQPFVTSNIIGATTMAQLEENLGSIDIQLSPELLREIEAIQTAYPNPSP